ncbi:MAG: hypothetical protein IPN01_18935 [Deltaproteobacteria bacterium]|nr:hypothetical protein [Deltaproteobacteria bacterium]
MTKTVLVERALDGQIRRVGRLKGDRPQGPMWVARGADGFPECAPEIAAALITYDYGLPQGARFFDAAGVERSRAGTPLRHFDLDALFTQGQEDQFVADGRYQRLLDALAVEDCFLDPPRRDPYGYFGGGEHDEALFGEAVPKWLGQWRAASLKHPQRSLVGLQPTRGVITPTLDPLVGVVGLETTLHGAVIGAFLSEEGHTPVAQAQLVALRASGVVIAAPVDAPWRPLGAASLGALACAAGALTAFAARRVSLPTLRALAARLKPQVDLAPRLPLLSDAPETLGPSPHLSLNGAVPIEGEALARVEWLRALNFWRPDDEDTDAAEAPFGATPLPLPIAEPGDGDDVPNVLYALARSYLIADDVALARWLGRARASGAKLLHEAARRVEHQLQSLDQPVYGDQARLGGLRDARAARRWMSEVWRGRGEPVAEAPALPEVQSPEALAELAWPLVFEPARLRLLRAGRLPQFPQLHALLTELEALEPWAWTLDLGLKMRAADARALAPFIASRCFDGSDSAAQLLSLGALTDWIRAEPRWGPVARAIAADPRMGFQRWRWLGLAGGPEDVPALTERVRALIQARAASDSALGFEQPTLLDALLILHPPSVVTLSREALQNPKLYPAERAELMQRLIRLGDAEAANALVAFPPPLNNVSMIWPYATAMVLAAPMLRPERKEMLRAQLGEPTRPAGRLAARLIRRALGDDDPSLDDELAELVRKSDGFIAEALPLWASCGALGPAALAAAQEHNNAAVRLAVLAHR